MKHGSLFSGIGGFDLAAEWMGWQNVFHVEKDPFCRQVLKHHFPQSDAYEDIKNFNGAAYNGGVDIITGGFPCQPFSAAGKRAGTSDNRYLWPEMFRIIREARPTYVVAENVRGFLSWNEGLVLDTVCADLESEGYEVCPVVLPAASVNAPHRRDRIWIVATNASRVGRERRRSEETQGRESQRAGLQLDAEGQSSGADATNANALRLQQRTDSREVGRGQSEVRREGNQFAEPIEATRAAWDATNAIGQRSQRRCATQRPEATKGHTGPRNAQPRDWQDFPTVPPICGGDDGLPKRLDNITFPKWRRESIKGYGNAIVPQVALQIFQAL